MSKKFGPWRTAMVTKNLIEKTFKHQGMEYTSSRQVQVGGGYIANNGLFVLEAQLDMMPSGDFGQMKGPQFAAVSAEFNAWGQAQLRIGYRHDLNDAVDDLATLGLGISPFGVVNVDIAFAVGERDTLGMGLNVGMAF
jgi:hypothetical protein